MERFYACGALERPRAARSTRTLDGHSELSADSEIWEFAAGFDASRRSDLENSGGFAEIIQRVRDEASDIALEIEVGKTPGLENYRRPVFTFSVQPKTFDAFFNGPQGYRAQFFASAEIGQAENNLVMTLLLDRLIATPTPLSAEHDVADIDLGRSLSACSAKIWIDERDFPFEDTPRDLAIRRWRINANLGVEKAQWGLCAPVGTNLEVKGAFLDRAGNEMVPSSKVRRRFDIHLFGYS